MLALRVFYAATRASARHHRDTTVCHRSWCHGPEADLGMFSMFSRTRPHKKGPPQEDLQIFATEEHAGNN